MVVKRVSSIGIWISWPLAFQKRCEDKRNYDIICQHSGGILCGSIYSMLSSKKMEDSDMAKKTVNFNKSGAAKLPKDKPVVYKIKTAGGNTNYVGVAHRGRAQERIQEHLDAGNIPGAKVQIEQVSSIAEARQKEQNIISKSQPKYNEQGK